jgi:ATP-dependent protease ClpP protease subunit
MILKIIGELNNDTISTMMDAYLAVLDEQQPLRVMVSSEGGNSDVFCVFVDLFSDLRARGMVETLAVGEVMSGAPLIVAAGSPGIRCAMKHTLFGLHEPFVSDVTDDPAVQNSEFRTLQSTVDRFYTLLSRLTGTSIRTWRNRIHGKSLVVFDAKQAQKWGLVDKVQKGELE